MIEAEGGSQRTTCHASTSVLRGTWNHDGRVGRLENADGVAGFLKLVHGWYEEGSLVPRTAWVVEWMEDGHDIIQRALVELDALPAETDDYAAALTTRARSVIAAGPPPEPRRFGASASGLRTRVEVHDLIESTSHAVQRGIHRVSEATLRDDEYAVMALNTSALEAVGWLRALDDLMQRVVWQQQVAPEVREHVSLEVDRQLSRPHFSQELLAECALENRVRPYEYWTQILIARGVWIPRVDMNAFRWLAGKLLHHGPLSVVELRHWRVGQKPRWVWREADAIFPPSRREERPQQRRAYAARLAGRDVAGTLNLTTVLIEMEHLFFRLLRESDVREPTPELLRQGRSAGVSVRPLADGGGAESRSSHEAIRG